MSWPKVNCLSIVTPRTFGLMGDCGEESQFTLISSKDNFRGGRLLCDGGDRSLKHIVQRRTPGRRMSCIFRQEFHLLNQVNVDSVNFESEP